MILDLKADDFTPLTSLWGTSGSPGYRTPPKLFTIDSYKYYEHYVEVFIKGNKKILPHHDPMMDLITKIIKYFPSKHRYSFINALTAQYRYSRFLFPGFIFLVAEILNSEWLSLLNLNKEHHRDHIVHQAYVTVIVYNLLHNIKISCRYSSLANEFASCLKKHTDILSTEFTLLDLAAFQLLKADSDTEFFQRILRKINNSSYITDPVYFCTALNFWKGVVRDAILTASLYHDIGYTISFMNRETQRANQAIREALMQLPNENKVIKKFRNRPIMNIFSETFNMGMLHPCPYPRYNDLNIIKETLRPALHDGHGLASAILYLMMNDKLHSLLPSKFNWRGILVMEIASIAMVRHDLLDLYWGEDNKKMVYRPKRPYLRLSFRNDPVSTILALADEIQAYGRVQKISGFTEGETVSIMLHYDVNKVRLEHNKTGKLTIRHFHSSRLSKEEREALVKYNNLLNNKLFDKKDGYLDLSMIYSDIKIESQFLR